MNLLRMGVAAAAVAGLCSVSPAEAATEVCAGTGVVATPAMFYPVPGTPPAQGALAGGLGLCTASGLLAVGGHVDGWCGRSNGIMVLNGHHAALFSTVGSTLLIGPGAAVGVGDMVPAVGQSCLTGATAFQTTAIVALI